MIERYIRVDGQLYAGDRQSRNIGPDDKPVMDPIAPDRPSDDHEWVWDSVTQTGTWQLSAESQRKLEEAKKAQIRDIFSQGLQEQAGSIDSTELSDLIDLSFQLGNLVDRAIELGYNPNLKPIAYQKIHGYINNPQLPQVLEPYRAQMLALFPLS